MSWSRHEPRERDGRMDLFSYDKNMKWWVNGAEIYEKAVPDGRNRQEESFCLDSYELIWWDWKDASAKLIMSLERKGEKRKNRWHNLTRKYWKTQKSFFDCIWLCTCSFAVTQKIRDGGKDDYSAWKEFRKKNGITYSRRVYDKEQTSVHVSHPLRSCRCCVPQVSFP